MLDTMPGIPCTPTHCRHAVCGYSIITAATPALVNWSTNHLAADCALQEFVWEAPVHFSLPEGEEVPAELRITVRGRLGHSGEPEVVGFGALNLGEVSHARRPESS